MTTAFQSNAFQNNAFQIDSGFAPDTHDGADGLPRKFHLPIYIGSGERKQEISNIIRIYDKAKELDNTEKLLSIVEPFVLPENDDELEKRAKAERVVDKLPDLDRINMEYLVKNQMAIDMLLEEMARIDLRIKRQRLIENEEDILLMLISACV